MVHLTIPDVDAGPVIAQSEVPILPTDSLADLEKRMHQAEHALLVTAVQTVLAWSFNNWFCRCSSLGDCVIIRLQVPLTDNFIKVGE